MIRIPESWLEDADRVSDIVSLPGMRVKRAGAIRLALRRGLTAYLEKPIGSGK